MKTLTMLASASTLALMLGAPAVVAQNALVGIEALDDRLDDINEDAQDELEEAQDDARFDPETSMPGWSGSMALTYAGTAGNTDTQDLALAGRFRYNIGQWQHNFGVGAEFGEDNGDKTKESVFAIYDGNYYFDDRLYGFVLARVERDEFAAYEKDAFLGFGPGYRIINTPDVTWRVQAGPGVRYTEPQVGDSETEAAIVAASRLFYRINDTVFLTNDTDILDSDSGTLATNDFGVNFAMTDMLSTRVSYRTEYNSDPIPGFDKTDNRLGVSLVMGF